MRDDMDKVINEPARRHGNERGVRSNRRAAHLDPESADAFRSMKQLHRNYTWDNTKEQSANWSVFSKFLKSRVGKKWDDVYSEIRKTINTDNPMVNMVTKHAAVLHLNCFFDDAGNLWSNTRYGPVSVGSEWRYTREEFYVHPDTGVLCISRKTQKKYKHPKQTPAEKLAKIRYIVPGTHSLVQYLRIPVWSKVVKTEEGHYVNEYRHVWYKVELRKATKDEIERKECGRWVSEDPEDFIYWKKQYFGTHAEIENGYHLLLNLHENVFGNYRWARVGADWPKFNDLFGGPFVPVNMSRLTGKELKKMEKMFS